MIEPKPNRMLRVSRRVQACADLANVDELPIADRPQDRRPDAKQQRDNRQHVQHPSGKTAHCRILPTAQLRPKPNRHA